MTYGEVRLAEELQFSVYNFEEAEMSQAVGALQAV